ncbi:MAG: glutamate-cysteine ligase family protein, partial [Nitrospirota bacterium]|nr:glutamate-cysteine ligase family protein [Nitrospirota bacterium]
MAGITHTPFHQRIIIGVEIEAYSINVTDHKIGRRLSKPRAGLSESGERFTRDASIGSEYNSRPFTTVRESLFLLKAGLRKYLRGLYRSREEDEDYRVPLFVGGWTNRFAGTHLHISVANRKLTKQEATSLSWHLHDQLPLLIATGANSPIWDKRVTTKASNRFLRGSATYFTPTKRGTLHSVDTRELVYSKGRKTKP